MFQVTEKMKAEVVKLDEATGFHNKWVVFYPDPDNEVLDGWDFELSRDYTVAREFYDEIRSPDNAGDAVMMAIAKCWPEKK